MTKKYFASCLQPENFGPGRLIGLVHGRKPRNIEVKFQWPPGIPAQSLLDEYRSNQEKNPAEAAPNFIAGYRSQLDSVFQNIKPEELPFQDGDTFLSWERAERNNYRKILAEYFQKLGYEVVVK